MKKNYNLSSSIKRSGISKKELIRFFLHFTIVAILWIFWEDIIYYGIMIILSILELAGAEWIGSKLRSIVQWIISNRRGTVLKYRVAAESLVNSKLENHNYGKTEFIVAQKFFYWVIK